MAIRSFRSRSLRRYWERGNPSGLRPEWVAKITRQLSALDAAVRPEDMDIVGMGYHRLSGDMVGRFSLTVSRNWRLTFGWDGQDAVEVDLEDCHG